MIEQYVIGFKLNMNNQFYEIYMILAEIYVPYCLVTINSKKPLTKTFEINL